MMFKFYNPTVQIQPQTGPDAGAAAEAFANKLSGVSKQAFALRQPLVTEESRKEGEEAGSKLGFKPLEENTPQDIVYNRAAVEAQKSIIQNRIRNSSMQFRQDAIQNLSPKSLGEYDSRMQSFVQTVKSGTTKELQPYVDNMSQYYGFANRAQVLGQVKGLNDNIARSNLQVSVNNNINDISRAAFHGDEISAAALRANIKKPLDSALETGLISGSYHASTMESIDKKIKYSHYEGQFHRALQSGKGSDAIRNFREDDQKDLTPEDKTYLDNRFNGMIREHKQDLAIQYGNVDQKAKDLESAIVLNGENSATIGSMAKMKSIVNDFYQDDPDKAAKINNDLDFAIQRHNFTDSMKFASPISIAKKLNDLDEELKENPTEQNVKNNQTLKSDLKALITARTEDPYSVAIKHPSVLNAINGERSAELGNTSLSSGEKMGSATKGNIDDVDNAIIGVQTAWGQPKSKIMIVPKSQLSELASAVSNAEPQQAVQMIQSVVAEHPGHANMVMSNLQTVIKPSNFMMLNIASNPETEKHSAFAYQAMQNDTKSIESLFDKRDITGIKDKVHDVFMKDYGQSLLNVNGDPTKLINSGTDYCYKLALIYKQNGIPDAEKTAVNDAVMAHSQVGTYNGYKYVIPNDNYYDPGTINHAVQSLIKGIDVDNVRVPDYYLPESNAKFRAKSYKDFLTSHAYPVTSNDNNSIRLMDDSRVPVKDKMGNDVGFKFQDLKLGDSSIRQSIAKDAKEKSKSRKLFEKGLLGFLSSGDQ